MNPRHQPAASPPHSAPEEILRQPERLARWLIQRAARHSGPALSARLEEEWLADLAVQRRGFSRLRFAIGCCWATRVIAHEHAGLGVPVGSSATGNGLAVALAHQDPSLFSRRTIVFLIIVGLHVLVIYAFANGLVRKVIEVIEQPPLVGFVSHPAPPDPVPQLTETNFPTPPLTPPWHELTPIVDPEEPAPSNDTAPQPWQGPPLPAPPTGAVNRVLGGPGRGFPDTDQYYPVASRRIGEAGIATVRVCVDDNGRLASEPSIAHSSGSVRLDEGALKLARAGSGHYRTTTENGRPVSFCYPLNVRFELRP